MAIINISAKDETLNDIWHPDLLHFDSRTIIAQAY